MGFFDTLKAMTIVKDIVKGGIATYKADEKLDELITRIREDYKDMLTEDEKELRKAYKAAKKELKEQEDSLSDEEKTALKNEVTDKKLAYLEAVSQNADLPEDFRGEIKNAVEEFKRAENLALDSLEEKLVHAAETEEDKEKVRETLTGMKRK